MISLKEAIKFLAEIVNNLHDILIHLSNDILGLQLTDKDLHFYIMGFIGICSFLVVYVISKKLSQLPFGITMLSFFYTLTFMFVLVFAIEIQQALTNRGNMEFIDAIIGLWGYIIFFLIYIAIVLLGISVKKIYDKVKSNQSRKIDY